MIRTIQRDRPVRLLVADDNRDFAANLADLARLHGFESRIVHSVHDAREAAEAQEYDVAVIDQRLPDGRGFDLLSRWRFEYPDLVPIVVTAFASIDSTLAALNQGAFAFVTKDSEPEVLVDALLRAAENSVLRRENRLLRRTQEAILAALPDQLLIVDHQLVVRASNRLDPRLCRTESSIVPPCPLLEFLSQGVADRLDWKRLINEVLVSGRVEASLTIRGEGDRVQTYSVRATRLDPKLRTLDRTDERRATTSSADALTLVQIVELTERVDLERRLSESEGLATLGRLVAIIAHELRNPITGIRALGQMLQKTLGSAHPEAESITEILALTDRMSLTLADILAYSRPRDWKEEPVDLRELTQRVAREGRRWPACEGRALDSVLPADGASVVVIGERERLFSALSNLVENALHACAEGGHVRLSLGTSDGFATITVEDDGPGIPQDRANRVFDPFFSTKKGGTGLGLPIVKTIVDRHGGNIAVGRSDELGGAAFTIRLPLDPVHRSR